MNAAAVYCRKSNEQNVSEDAKSVHRQIELARVFAERRGWTVADADVYIDDAISGAEYVKRPAYNRLMAAVKAGPAFRVLVVMEQSRLGRDTGRVLLAIQEIEEAGVEIWSYQGSGSRISLEDESGEVNATVLGLVDKLHRRQASKRGRETMGLIAERGHVAGGLVFGYTNVPVTIGGRRSHVERQITEAEADVVRRIFHEIAEGHGFIRIARGLDADGTPSPRRHQGWAASGVREIVFRDLYRGQQLYGKTRWEYRQGRKVKVDVPASDWTRVEVPALRIVSEEQWAAAHRRLDRTRQTYLRHTNGKLWGRPESGIESKWLLAGFLTCSVCGGGMSATWSFDARRERKSYYRCNTRRARGTWLCSNNHTVSVPGLDQDVLQQLREDVLTRERIERVVRRAIELHTAHPGDTEGQRQTLLEELRRLDRELAEFNRAVAAGASDILALVDAMRATQRRRDEVAGRLEQMDGLDRAVGTWDRLALTDELTARLAEWQDVLTGQPVQGRQILRRLIVGRLAVTPQEDERGRCTAHAWAGEASYGRLLAGIIGGQPFGVPWGSEGLYTVQVGGIVRAA